MITLTREEAQQLLDFIDSVTEGEWPPHDFTRDDLVQMLRATLSAPKPEPVAWLITDEMINSLQVDSIQRLIDRALHAHMTDIKLRINGQDEWYQADWIKHMKRAAPPQRGWQGLTDEEHVQIAADAGCASADWVFYGAALERALKEKNK